MAEKVSGPFAGKKNKNGFILSNIDRTKPNTPWYHLNSWQADACPRAQCPGNGGNPFQPTAAHAGSIGLLAGDVRKCSFTGAYTDRSLSAHPGMPTSPLIAFVMIVIYHISIGKVCQFLFRDFL